MTVGAWIFFLAVACVICIICTVIGYDTGDQKGIVFGLLVGIAISAVLLAFLIWLYSSTAWGARRMKSQESNFSNGMPRKVTVYGVSGNPIKEYEGRFDIEYDDDRILFDDENGLRHVIYYPTGTVIIDEVEGS